MNEDGVTLVELIVVFSVMVALVVGLAFTFQGWMSTHKIESEIKDMYVDLTNARARAMQSNRMYFVTFAANQYTIYADTNPAPDGNGTLETASDTRVLQKNTNAVYPINATTANPLRFTTNGLAVKADLPYSDATLGSYGTVRLENTGSNPDYDCIFVSETRTNFGKWNPSYANCLLK
jgi:Tfp pilus assembly protein FimT